MAVTYVGAIGATNDASSYTSASLDFTGASLLVAGVVAEGSSAAFSDSNGNTWTAWPGSPYNAASSRYLKLYYVASPTGTTGTFSSSVKGSLGVVAFAGTHASPFGNEAGAGDVFVSSKQPGSITPPENNCVVVGFGTHDDGSGTITGLTEVLDIDGLGEQSLLVGYTIQTTAAAINPTFTNTSSIYMIAAQASFKSAGAAAATSTLGPRRRMRQNPSMWRRAA